MNLKIIIDRFEGDKAVLRFDDGQQLIIDKSFLLDKAKEGDVLNLNLSLDAETKKETTDSAKMLLQQILNKK